MDPISGFATIVALAADFVSQRKATHDASVEEFKDWLASQRHEDIINLLDSNTATTVGIKSLIHESHSEILNRLEQIKLQTLSLSEQSSQSQGGVAADVIEEVVLGINNSFVGTASDISALASRCAVYAIEGKRVNF